MPDFRLILCEKANHWAGALRSSLHGSDWQLIETRSLAACQAALEESAASFVGLEVTPANLDSAVEFVATCRSRYPHAVVVALLSIEMSPASTLLREAGAIDVATSVLDAPRLRRLAQRYFQQTPQPALTLQQLVAERLPWPSHASTNAFRR